MEVEPIKNAADFPRCSMYGILTYIYPMNDPNVGKYTIHGASAFYFGNLLMFPMGFRNGQDHPKSPVARGVVQGARKPTQTEISIHIFCPKSS